MSIKRGESAGRLTDGADELARFCRFCERHLRLEDGSGASEPAHK